MTDDSLSLSINYSKENFDSYKWYWGDVKKEIVAFAMEVKKFDLFKKCTFLFFEFLVI